MPRRGFTLIEMLVATVVFAVGFVGVFGLFLAGMRFRKQSEDLTRCSLAASSLVSEIAIDAGRDGQTDAHPPEEPSAYVGDGFAGVSHPAGAPAPLADDDAAILAPYRAQPGIFYRVESCTDLVGTDLPDTTVIRLKLLVVPWATVDPTISLLDIARRLQLREPGTGTLLTDPTAIASELTRRGLALRTDAVITRRPAWMP